MGQIKQTTSNERMTSDDQTGTIADLAAVRDLDAIEARAKEPDCRLPSGARPMRCADFDIHPDAIFHCPECREARTTLALVAEVRSLRAEVAAVEAEGERLAAALALALLDAHPTYGSTTGWRGGIGGAAITTGCSITDPPPGDDWMGLMLTEPLRDFIRAHPDFKLDAAKASLADDLRAALATGEGQ